MGISVTVIPLVCLTFNIIYSLVALPAGILSGRTGPKPIIFSSFILFGFVYLGFAKACRPVQMWVLFIFYGIFMAITEGIQKAFLAAIIPQDFKATGFGPFICLFAFQTEKTVILMYVVKELFRIPDYIRMDKEEK